MASCFFAFFCGVVTGLLLGSFFYLASRVFITVSVCLLSYAVELLLVPFFYMAYLLVLGWSTLAYLLASLLLTTAMWLQAAYCYGRRIVALINPSRLAPYPTRIVLRFARLVLCFFNCLLIIAAYHFNRGAYRVFSVTVWILEFISEEITSYVFNPNNSKLRGFFVEVRSAAIQSLVDFFRFLVRWD